jgi:hypothetical protein
MTANARVRGDKDGVVTLAFQRVFAVYGHKITSTSDNYGMSCPCSMCRPGCSPSRASNPPIGKPCFQTCNDTWTQIRRTSQALSTPERQKASDLRKHCARGGTRTAFQPLQILGIRENMRNPEQFEGCTKQSETKSVDNVRRLP